ncbi:MAG: HEPN domain-containing protein [Chloroflexi bacterium]|nr:HEPN domain-containing protein [Chloroflexota bacterium]
MSFEWAAYLELAENLAGTPEDDPCLEAKLRSAISRAYYAAFCTARNHIRDVEGESVPQSPRIHEFVSAHFKVESDHSHRDVGVNLDRLRLIRNRADYDDDLDGLKAMAQKALHRAQHVINRLEGLP